MIDGAMKVSLCPFLVSHRPYSYPKFNLINVRREKAKLSENYI